MLRDMEFGLTSREKAPNREAANRQAMGGKKYSERIAKDSKSSSSSGDQFKFSKPSRNAPTSIICECPGCETTFNVTKTTVVVICRKCEKIFDVDEETILRK